jgi:hypothetical protein
MDLQTMPSSSSTQMKSAEEIDKGFAQGKEFEAAMG